MSRINKLTKIQYNFYMKNEIVFFSKKNINNKLVNNTILNKLKYPKDD